MGPPKKNAPCTPRTREPLARLRGRLQLQPLNASTAKPILSGRPRPGPGRRGAWRGHQVAGPVFRDYCSSIDAVVRYYFGIFIFIFIFLIPSARRITTASLGSPSAGFARHPMQRGHQRPNSFCRTPRDLAAAEGCSTIPRGPAALLLARNLSSCEHTSTRQIPRLELAHDWRKRQEAEAERVVLYD